MVNNDNESSISSIPYFDDNNLEKQKKRIGDWKENAKMHLSPRQELDVGMHLFIEKYSNEVKRGVTPTQALAQVARNPEHAVITVLRNAIERSIEPNFMTKLDSMVTTKKSPEEILGYVAKNISPIVNTPLFKEFHAKHLENNSKGSDKESAKDKTDNELRNFIVFQLVLASYISNNKTNTDKIKYMNQVNQASKSNPEIKKMINQIISQKSEKTVLSSETMSKLNETVKSIQEKSSPKWVAGKTPTSWVRGEVMSNSFNAVKNESKRSSQNQSKTDSTPTTPRQKNR